MAVGRPTLACHRLVGKQLIILNETRAGVVTPSMAHPVQVREGQLTHRALRRLHDEHDGSSLVYREHFGNGHEWYPPLPTGGRVPYSSHPTDIPPPRCLTRHGGSVGLDPTPERPGSALPGVRMSSPPGMLVQPPQAKAPESRDALAEPHRRPQARFHAVTLRPRRAPGRRRRVAAGPLRPAARPHRAVSDPGRAPAQRRRSRRPIAPPRDS